MDKAEQKRIVDSLNDEQLAMFHYISQGVTMLYKQLEDMFGTMELQNTAIEKAADFVTEYKMLKFDRDCLKDEVEALKRRLGE